MEWQAQCLSSLVAWRNFDGTRRFRFANIHLPKKQGKTLLVSLISAFELLAAGVPSPFVVTGSVSKDNAGQVFAELAHTLRSLDPDRQWHQPTPNQKRLRIPGLNAEYRSLASDGDRVQGYNCSLVVLDECHAHKSSSLYDSLKYATISRRDGLVVAISTAGDDPSCYYHAIYEKSKRVISGEDLDTTHYALVFESEADADPEDPDEWAKANPSLGTSFTSESFKLDLEAAKSNADRSEWWRFLRYRLNRWVRSDDQQYFDVNVWDRGKLDDERDLTDKDCWLGVDLSLTTDPSAVTAVWHLGERKFYAKSWAWVAEEGVKLREKTSLPKYLQFEAEGHLTVTDGDRIDDELILNHVLDLGEQYRVQGVVFDPTSAIAMMGRVEAAGIDVFRVTQSHKNFNAPMKELSKAIAEGRMHHDGNNWLRYCLSSVRVHETRDGLIRPSARKSTDHIDGAVALLMAFSAAVQAQPQETAPVVWI